MPVDNSVIKGRKHIEAHIKSFIHKGRWSWWYRRNKPDHARSNEDDYAYSVVNAEPHGDIDDQSVHPYSYSGHPFERVNDNPDQWELIGQIPIVIFNKISSIVAANDMQYKVIKAKATVPFDYNVDLDDRIIELDENVNEANRTEWKIEDKVSRAGLYWVVSLTGLVGVHG